jgi:phosphatidylserine/phosphatidylglycerophosphate/cardiolipin synthase-like enzyme
MRRPAWIAAACLALAAPHLHATDTLAAQGSLQAAFAPWDNVEELIADAIGGAGKQILVQAYLLTSKKIGSTLISAHRRGVDVRVLVDAEQLTKAASTMVPEIAAAGIPVWTETKYQNAHNKIIVIDPAMPDATVITGSYNFTWTAQHKNAENILIVRKNSALASRYVLNWERHRQDALPYKK